MKIVAFVPIKLNNQRLPGKNLLPLGGKPICKHILDTLLSINGIEDIYVYCSDEQIKNYLPNGIKFLKRDAALDGNFVKGIDIYKSFVNDVHADIYLLAHCTSPFIKASSIQYSLDIVKSKKYDSALAVEKKQTFAWYNGEVLNYEPQNVPRTQDIEPVYIETSAFYIFNRELLIEHNRRVGFNPFLCVIDAFESIDIDEPNDFKLAQSVYEVIK
ncbi:MAG: acylneuraminate cytidylyltransferase family protein [Fibromonadaceae bacterium]|jgi:CMP-N-acetylneuraminic acid synthetase|nr:acylneuraminate cytidylyltransferase family protein [Fibromonadaceae bacterium]